MRSDAQLRRRLDARAGIARQDMAFGLAGMVRPVCRGRRAWIEGTRQSWMDGWIEIQGPELDAADLGVLLALLAIALRQGGDQALGQEVDGLLAAPAGPARNAAQNAAGEQSAITLRTTMAELCREIDRDPGAGSAHQAIRASLTRLAGVVFRAETADGRWAVTHLIAGGAGAGRGAVIVSLSYRLTRALLGQGSYSRIDMAAWRQLAPVAKCLTHWLACWYGAGSGERRIGLDKLATHVWGEAAHGATGRRQRQQLRNALGEIEASGGWIARECGGVVTIERTKPVALSTQTRRLEYAPTAGSVQRRGFQGEAAFL